ncbi:AAA family ATPase [Candidatus Woesearchaeota archaeon]|nr:AAA family ATPase [Candidatus Woesearchaeota archaeon]
MIITISGIPGAGKSTVGKILAKKLDYRFLSMGDLRGVIAVKHGMTIDELNEIGKTEEWTDKEPDKELIRIGEQEDDYVIDTWIGFHLIPDSVKIFLKIDMRKGAERIFKDQRPDEPEKETIEEAEEMLKKRVKDTNDRFKKYYDADFLDESHYDLIIDTTSLTQEQVVEKIIVYIENFKLK